MTRGKRMRAAFACAAVVVSVVVGIIPSEAQADLAKALVGKWEGDANFKRDSPPRTLIISAVQEHDGKWVADGKFGDPGMRMHSVDIAIDTANNEVVLRFTQPGKTPAAVVLTLYKDGKHLLERIAR